VDYKETNEHVEEDESKVGIPVLHFRWLPVTFVDYGCFNLKNKKRHHPHLCYDTEIDLCCLVACSACLIWFC
jgi:hypothetical protein